LLTGCKNFAGKRNKYIPVFSAFVDSKPMERFENWSDICVFKSLDNSASKRVLDLLEPVKLTVWKVVIEIPVSCSMPGGGRLTSSDVTSDVLSCLQLKECIRSIDQETYHTPYRQSKLTQILRESFVGNCQTVMIANIAPTQSARDNTLNTLHYADRCCEPT